MDHFALNSHLTKKQQYFFPKNGFMVCYKFCSTCKVALTIRPSGRRALRTATTATTVWKSSTTTVPGWASASASATTFILFST